MGMDNKNKSSNSLEVGTQYGHAVCLQMERTEREREREGLQFTWSILEIPMKNLINYQEVSKDNSFKLALRIVRKI
jgi:hypothetical protein